MNLRSTSRICKFVSRENQSGDERREGSELKVGYAVDTGSWARLGTDFVRIFEKTPVPKF